jgi:Heparan-alpha-glucosaminide N-acetyltransferase, catalytic
MVLNRKYTTTRLSSLDILRGIAVLFMVEAHIAIIIPFFSPLAASFAAPAFLFVAGVSFQLLLRNRKSRGTSTRDTFWEVFWRAATLFFLTSAITWTADLLLGLGTSVFTNVFVIISTGFLVGFAVRKSFKWKILAIVLILILDLVIRAYNIQYLAFLTGTEQGALQVTILPNLCFFIFGQIAYKAYKQANYNWYDNQILLVYAVLFFMLNLAAYLAFPYHFLSQGRGYLPGILMIASLLIILALLLVRVVDLDGRLKRVLWPLEGLGRISFTAYYITYASFLVLGSFQFQPPLTANLLIFFLTSVGLVVLERLWRPQYRYGVEWFYRKISARALSYTRRVR